MAGGQVDGAVVVLTGLVLALVVVGVVRAYPRPFAVAWAVVIAFVPYWMGVSFVVYLPPASALAGLVVVGLIGRRPAPLRIPDAVVALVVVLTVVAAALGQVTMRAVFLVVVEWALSYALARLLAAQMPVDEIGSAVAVVLAAAAVLAVVEFATGTNLFVGLGPSTGLHHGWSGLQERGGILRAEGAFGHSIALGASLSMAIPLALGSRLGSRAKLATVAALVAGAVVSFSRIGIGTAVLGIVLSVLLLGRRLRTRVKVAVTTALAVATVIGYPYVDQVFSAAGEEAAGSAEYRGDLLSLVPTMQVIGTASSAQRSADGTLRFGAFRSIDSALIYAGLTYGWLIMAILAALFLACVVTVLRGRATPAGVSVAAQLPAVLTVAFITQYSALFWFIAGLAVSAYAERAVLPTELGRGQGSGRTLHEPSQPAHSGRPVGHGSHGRTIDPA